MWPVTFIYLWGSCFMLHYSCWAWVHTMHSSVIAKDTPLSFTTGLVEQSESWLGYQYMVGKIPPPGWNRGRVADENGWKNFNLPLMFRRVCTVSPWSPLYDVWGYQRNQFSICIYYSLRNLIWLKNMQVQLVHT